MLTIWNFAHVLAAAVYIAWWGLKVRMEIFGKWWRHTSVLYCTHYIESCLSIFSRTLAVPVVFRRIDQSSKVALRSLKIVYRVEQYAFSSTTQFLFVCYYWNLFSRNMAAMHIPSISVFFASSTITKDQNKYYDPLTIMIQLNIK